MGDLVYRRLAHPLVVALLPLRVPPPAVVLAATAAGLAAAVEIARGELAAAAALVVAKTLLDNADGQLARAADRVSAFGRYLDSESDLLVDAALFAGLGYLLGEWLLPLAAFLTLTLVLSANFNLRRLYELAHGGRDESTPEGGGLVRSIYALVYGPQDRAFGRLAGRGRAYHDRGTLVVLHNLGLSTQMTALALFLAAGSPRLGLWFVLACGLVLVAVMARRELRASTDLTV